MAELKNVKFYISILGYQRVGKSSIISSYFGFPFDDNVVPTRGIDYITDIAEFENKNYKFKIYDTVGGIKYRSISSKAIQRADGFLLVFSLDMSSSFDEVKYWLNIIKEKVNIEEKAIILVGNKNDIKGREIPFEEVSSFVESNHLKYFETLQ